MYASPVRRRLDPVDEPLVPLPLRVRNDLLYETNEGDGIFRALHPVLVARGLFDLSRGGGAPSMQAFVLVDYIRDYFRTNRAGKVRPRPTESELARAFGVDAVLVAALWPAVAFLEAAEAVTDRELGLAGHDVARGDLAVWSEARIFFLLRSPVPGTMDRWLEFLGRHIAKVARRRNEQQDDVVEDVASFLSEHSEDVLDYQPLGQPAKVIAYFRLIINRAAGRRAHVQRRALGAAAARAIAGVATSDDAAPIGSSTFRSYARELGPNASSEEIEAERDARQARKRHHNDGYSNVSEAARLVGASARTFLKALQEETNESGECPPRQGRVYLLSADWIRRVARRLKTKRRRGVIDGYSLRELAEAGGHNLRDVRATFKQVLEERALEPPPKVRNVYRLGPAWLRELEKRLCSES